MNKEQMHKLNQQIARRIAEEIEGKIRTWINLEGDEKMQALLRTIEVKEKQIREMHTIGDQLIKMIKGTAESPDCRLEMSSNVEALLQVARRVFPEFETKLITTP